jgi:hypothetical protein
MENTQKVVQASYALSIVVLGYFVISQVARYLQFNSEQLFLYLAVIGSILLALGLFKFKKGLGFGLVLTGIWSLIHGSLPFWGKVTDLLRFSLAFFALLIIGYALYRLQRQGK